MIAWYWRVVGVLNDTAVDALGVVPVVASVVAPVTSRMYR